MTSANELDERMRQIDGWIRALINEAHFLDERVHLLKPLVLDHDVQAAMKAKLDQTQGVGLWNHLVPLLGQDYIRELARLFLDKGEKTGSLTNIWRKLQVPGVREHYRDNYGRMFDDLHHEPIGGVSEEVQEQWRKRERVENMTRFGEAWAAISQAMDDLAKDPIGNSIKTFRDKRHAHWEMQPLKKEAKPFDISALGLTFNGVFAFGQKCEQILADLGKLLTHTRWEPSEFTEMSAEQGKALWMTLAT